MIFNTQLLALATLASTFVSALPLDTNQARDIAPRAKSYSVVNVGGGASTEAPADATTVVDQATKTVEVTNAGPTVTAKVTTTIVEPVPAPAATSTSSSTSSPAPTSRSTTTKAATTSPSTTATPTPVFVTITVTDDAGPTEYYDNGMWHTSYRIKTFNAVATPSILSTLSDIAASSTALPAW